ncbi:MAG: insulinase family protein, partial [Deltaproteobacteria bacterium]|nr:insulinase family protein [Deltaproteobacteria bacterium]
MSAALPPRPIHLPEIHLRRLPGGLEVYCAPWRELPLVSIHWILPAGAEGDPPAKGGAADLAAEMLTLGTKQKSASQLAATVDGLGASLSARAGWD